MLIRPWAITRVYNHALSTPESAQTFSGHPLRMSGLCQSNGLDLTKGREGNEIYIRPLGWLGFPIGQWGLLSR